MSCTYLSYDWLFFLIAFLPSIFQAQRIQVGSVYIVSASGKTRVAVRSRADGGTSDNFFLLRSVLEQCAAFCYAAFMRYQVVPVNTSDGQSSSGVCAISSGICLWTFSKSSVLFRGYCLQSWKTVSNEVFFCKYSCLYYSDGPVSPSMARSEIW